MLYSCNDLCFVWHSAELSIPRDGCPWKIAAPHQSASRSPQCIKLCPAGHLVCELVMERLRRRDHPPATSDNQNNPTSRKIMENFSGLWASEQICISNLISCQEAFGAAFWLESSWSSSVISHSPSAQAASLCCNPKSFAVHRRRTASYWGWPRAMRELLFEPSVKLRGIWFFLPFIWRPFKPREVASAVPHLQGHSLSPDARWQPGPYPSSKRDPRWQNSYHHCTCQRFHVSYHFAEGKCLLSVTAVNAAPSAERDIACSTWACMCRCCVIMEC